MTTPRPGLVLVQAWLPKDLHKQVKTAAKVDAQTMSEWLRTAVREKLQAGRRKKA